MHQELPTHIINKLPNARLDLWTLSDCMGLLRCLSSLFCNFIYKRKPMGLYIAIISVSRQPPAPEDAHDAYEFHLDSV